MKLLTPELEQRQRQHLYRRRTTLQSPQDTHVLIAGRSYLSFCSNDYLGLANHPEVIRALQQGAEKFGAGSGASHLISGHSTAHQHLEEALAEFTHRPRALLFSTGYMANLGVISALASAGDRLFADRLNHASLIDGALLSRARLQRYHHRDINDLQRRLNKQPEHPGQDFIISDGIFSMDGDLAPLSEMAAVADKSRAWLMVDDAHGLGVLGPEGRGTSACFQLGVQELPILVGTLGKAFGTCGAFVAGSKELIDYLIQFARTYIYTTAISPAIAHATLTSLRLVREEVWRRDQLQRLCRRFITGAGQLGLPVPIRPVEAIQAPIIPLLIGDSERALAVSNTLAEKGMLISAIRPPTVPRGSARLRITLCANHQPEHIDRLLECLAAAL